MNLDTISVHERRAIYLWLLLSITLITALVFAISITSYRQSQRFQTLKQAHEKIVPCSQNSPKIYKKHLRIKEHRATQQQLQNLLDDLERILPADVRLTSLSYFSKKPCAISLEAQGTQALTHALEIINSIYPIVVTSFKTTKPSSAHIEITLLSEKKS